MKTAIDTAPKQQTAILVAMATLAQPLPKTQEYLEELCLLCYTLQVKVVKTFVQHLRAPHAKTLVGRGKLEEIREFTQTTPVDKVIFDDELTPSQARSIEGILACTVSDRSAIILDIFAMRAKTREAKIQVELAQYQYMLPRLKRLWTHLSRQHGGVSGASGMRGPGEKELETDRRLVHNKVALLKKKLALIDKQRLVQRKEREAILHIALVGYTNVGKSTLMQLLAKSETYIEDKLFATITPTTRRIMVQDILCLLTDTVGFIRKLPPQLVVSFKSTLDEICHAHLLLHVVDGSHPAWKEHIEVVQQTLQEIGADHIPMLLIFNKIDLLPASEQPTALAETPTSLEDLERYSLLMPYPTIMISAKEKLHIARLKDFIYQHMPPQPSQYLQARSFAPTVS
jgi:GTP-binding protein HflX